MLQCQRFLCLLPFWKDLFEIVWLDVSGVRNTLVEIIGKLVVLRLEDVSKYLPWHDAIINLAGLRSKMTIPACWRCLSVVKGSVRCCHDFGDAHFVW